MIRNPAIASAAIMTIALMAGCSSDSHDKQHEDGAKSKHSSSFAIKKVAKEFVQKNAKSMYKDECDYVTPTGWDKFGCSRSSNEGSDSPVGKMRTSGMQKVPAKDEYARGYGLMVSYALKANNTTYHEHTAVRVVKHKGKWLIEQQVDGGPDIGNKNPVWASLMLRR